MNKTLKPKPLMVIHGASFFVSRRAGWLVARIKGKEGLEQATIKINTGRQKTHSTIPAGNAMQIAKTMASKNRSPQTPISTKIATEQKKQEIARRLCCKKQFSY